jgi:hypothetical protein
MEISWLWKLGWKMLDRCPISSKISVGLVNCLSSNFFSVKRCTIHLVSLHLKKNCTLEMKNCKYDCGLVFHLFLWMLIENRQPYGRKRPFLWVSFFLHVSLNCPNKLFIWTSDFFFSGKCKFSIQVARSD